MTLELWAFFGALALVYLGFILGWAYYGGKIAELRRQLIDLKLVDEAIDEAGK
jgi:hypothetical protein